MAPFKNSFFISLSMKLAFMIKNCIHLTGDSFLELPCESSRGPGSGRWPPASWTINEFPVMSHDIIVRKNNNSLIIPLAKSYHSGIYVFKDCYSII